jgi:hypothetical protein
MGQPHNGGRMDIAKLKAHLPTIPQYLEKRRKAKQNRLPKHLRPLDVWPLWVQIALNSGLIMTLYNLMVNRDDYLSEAGPALVMVGCLLLLIYTLISAVQKRHIYHNIRGQRLAKLNFALMVLAFLLWAGSIVVFLS